MSLSLPKRIFISSVSRELRSYRLALANHLANIPSKPEIKVQEDFQQGGATLLEKLAEYVRYCDLVIHLVGRALGFCPTPEHERTLLHSLGEPDTTPLPHYSATQWEYHLARRFGVRTLVYVASDKARPDCGLPIPQSDDEAAAQARHRDSMRPGDRQLLVPVVQQSPPQHAGIDIKVDPPQVALDGDLPQTGGTEHQIV